jgi:hypothetical protein
MTDNSPILSKKATVTNDELAALIGTLRQHDQAANYPVRMDLGEYAGDDWLLGFGSSDRDGKFVNVTIQTDRVHGSDMTGDAIDDAAAYVYLRNNLPVVVSALEELLVHRMI